MKLVISPAALKILARMPAKERAALLEKLRIAAASPDARHAWARRLEGSTAFRIRHGDWPAIYRLERESGVMLVDRVAKREDAYR